MTYALSAALQSAVYARLRNDLPLANLVGDAIYDTLPAGPRPTLYVAFGPEQVRDQSDKTGAGALHDLTISVVSDASGFMRAKDVAAAVSDVLHDADLDLSRGSLVFMNFYRARAVRARNGETRRIDLTFRARVCDSTAP